MTFHPSYVGPRADVVALVPGTARRVLDVGCSAGAVGEALKRRGVAEVVGIELDPELARAARTKLDRVVVGDVARMALADAIGTGPFDCLILADVLEHLEDPWTVLRDLAGLLAAGGTVVASVPNVRHVSTLFDLAVRGYWPYRDRGIHDRTHLRFFTLRNVRELFEQAGLTVRDIRRNYRVIERPHRLNRLAPLLAVPGFRGFLAFQYLVRACRAGTP